MDPSQASSRCGAIRVVVLLKPQLKLPHLLIIDGFV